MAVYCGVCATRIFSAPENDGSFSTRGSFGGWDEGAAIRDTCEDCGALLRAAVTEAARKIASRHQPAIRALRSQIGTWAKEAKEEREEFERAWRAKKEEEKR